jgi:hypothetical protein
MNRNKWITLTFSDIPPSLIPSENHICEGVAGLRHVERGYLSRLPCIAKKLNRKFIFPKPFILFGHRNENDLTSLEDEITDYYYIPTHKNPPFYFEKNGRVIPTNEKLT